MTSYGPKTVTLDLADWEHICAAIGDEADKFRDMGRDKDFARQVAGEAGDESQAIWAQHATFLNDLHRRIKEQVGLPR